MSLQAKWNTALTAIAGIKALGEKKEKDECAERIAGLREQRESANTERAQAQAELAQLRLQRARRASPKKMGTTEGLAEEAEAEGSEAQEQGVQITNEQAAARAQQHIEQADTPRNNVSSVIEGLHRERKKPRGQLRKKRIRQEQRREESLQRNEEGGES